jgi:hypothetical protein
MTILAEALGGAAAALGKRAVDAALGKERKKKGAPRMGKKGKKGKKDHQPKPGTEDRIAKALAGLRRSASSDPSLDDFREDLFGELRKLIRPAIGQAKKGKPALLRILTRYSR